MSNDSFYTPTFLARKLVSHVSLVNCKSVVDFCIGDGELIRAALERWPDAKCYGTDLSNQVILSNKRRHPSWELSKCNFLNSKSRNTSKVIKYASDGMDLILLNPPFSCIGGTKHSICFKASIYKVSIAMAFLVEALKYLSPTGYLYAILPNSIAYAQKDQDLWKKLNIEYNISILDESKDRHFQQCAAKVILVSISTSSPIKNDVFDTKLLTINKDIQIFRGKLSMYKLSEIQQGKLYLIHTTNLINNTIKHLKYKICYGSSQIKGPALLLPRVGQPNPQKLCVITSKDEYILSDCILAIKTKTDKDAELLLDTLLKDWNVVNELYKGTGAAYTTVDRLQEYFNLQVVKNS